MLIEQTSDPAAHLELPGPLSQLRIALVNDWLVHVRGQERVFSTICDAFPSADVYTLVYDADQMPEAYARRGVRTSFVQHLPAAKSKFRAYLPLYPLAARSIDLRSYDLVITSSSAFVQGVTVSDATILVSYCHSPFRYVWSHWHTAVRQRLGALATALVPVRSLLRAWDVEAARRVDYFIAPSRLIQQRIADLYGRDSVVIPPAVDLDAFRPLKGRREEYYLLVSPLQRWKRVDVAIEAFAQLGLPLRVVGSGEVEKRLRQDAPSNIDFVGWRKHDEVTDLAQLYARCKALILTSEEDFGLAPIEAMACGVPVIAFRGGGALETVVDGLTGCFYDQQTPQALIDAVMTTDCLAFDQVAIRDWASQFGVDAFRQRMTAQVQRWVSKTCKTLRYRQ